MGLTQLGTPYPVFTDKNGSPLDNGYVYFGTVYENPETNPIQVFYDPGLTQIAAQPLRTSNGYVMRNGSPAILYAANLFSVTLRDKNGALIIYAPAGYGVSPYDIAGPASAEVVIVAGIAAEVTAVAAISDEVEAVGNIAADVVTVAGISAEVIAVSADATDIGIVASNIANVNTVAGISANVTTVAGISADVTAVAADATDIGTVASNIANVNTVAGISANVTTVAGISANVTTVAGISADVSSVAAIAADITAVAAIDADVTTVAGISADVVIAAANSADITNFSDVYQGPYAIAPTVRTNGGALLTGDLYFNTTTDDMWVYDGAQWLAAYASLSGALMAASNLSDLDDAVIALQNLGLTATAAELNYTDGVTSAIQTQLNDKAPIASPTFTGTPAAPTAPVATNTTQIATTAFVLANAPASGTQTFTAVGSITAGDLVSSTPNANSVKKVGILTDGSVTGGWTPVATVDYGAGFYSYCRPCKMTSNTFVFARQQSGTSPYPISVAVSTIAADGTVTTGSFVTAVTGFSTTGQWSVNNSLLKISSTTFLLFYGLTSNTLSAIAGSISGTTITFGTAVSIYGATTTFQSVATNGAGQVLITANNAGAPYASKVVALTVSGTTITVGASTTWYSGTAYTNTNTDALAYDPVADKYFLATSISSTKAIFGTVFSVSGTTITVGTTSSLGAELPSSTYPGLSVKYVPSIARMAILIGGYNETFTLSTVSISGLTFTRASTSVTFYSFTNAMWQSSTGEICIAVNQEPSAIFFNATTYQPYVAKIPAYQSGLVIGAYETLVDIGYGFYGRVLPASVNPTLYKAALSSAATVIGLANSTVTDGQSVSIAVNGGVCSSLTGLVTGAKYYSDSNGVLTLSTVNSTKFVGTAMSSTKLLVSPQTGV